MSQIDLLTVGPELDISGRVVGSAESDEHYTPTAVFQPWNEEFHLTLDACATAESAKVPYFFSINDDGLKQPWTGARVWCNPPYSDIAPWIRKATYEVSDGWCPLVVMLVPAWTDRAWWQEYVEPHRDGRGRNLVQTRFLKRIRFGTPGDPEGLKSGSPAFWPALLVWRRN